MPLDLLIIGPASRDTGGVARYVSEQQRVLPEDVVPRVFDVRTPPGTGWRRFSYALAVTLLDFLRFPFRSRPDVVHVHSSYGFAFYRAAYYVLVASLLWRRPVVFHVHGSSFDTFLASAGRVERWIQTVVFGHCDRVIALSDGWKDVLSARVPPHRILVVPNAVDPNQYEPATETDPPSVVFVSNLIERKGVAEFASAIDRLQGNGAPPFTVDVAGDGPLADRIEALADEHESVAYHGYVSERRKRELLEEGAIYVLPTYAEGLPIALLEGMAGGNAVVATRVAAIPDVLDEDGGALIEPGDADALAGSIQEFLVAADLESVGQHNHERIEDEYSWDTVSERLSTTYRELAAR